MDSSTTIFATNETKKTAKISNTASSSTIKCMIVIFICCAIIVYLGMTSSTIARLLSLRSTNFETNDSIFLILKYNSDLVNGNALGLIDLYRLKNNLIKQWPWTQITIYKAYFISSFMDRMIQTRKIIHNLRTNDIQYKGDSFVTLISIQHAFDCVSIDCRNNFVVDINNFIANVNQNVELPITFTTNQQTISVHLRFSSSQLIDKDKIKQLLYNDSTNEQNHHQDYKRQAAQSTTTQTTTSSSSGSLTDISTPLFFPKFLGNFQLALKSNTSIVVVIGNDYNIYLSPQYSSKIQPSTFALYDLQLSNQSAVAVIKDATNQRYLHVYNDIQTKGFSRLRTHLETYMPCGSNIIFWIFMGGYLQFYRGGEWAYDTAGCLDPLTGLVKIWIINGQQGLTALQAKYETCGLAPLVPINYF